MNLTELAAGYLQSLAYETTLRGRDLVVGNRLSIAGERDTILVWVPSLQPEQSFSSQERPYLSRFENAVKDSPRAQKFMLVSTFEGLSREFRSRAKREYDVNIRMPIQFFDTLFKWEESEGTQASFTAGKLRTRGEEQTRARVPQPYIVRDGSEAQHGEDILDTLVRKISAQSGGGLNLVVGPAGIGKTVFFQGLFANLYSTFQEHKSQLRVFPRPLPLVPEYFRVSVGRTLINLVEGFLRTEFVAPIGRDTFQWMLTNGFAIWLLDGLDELIDRDTNFFMELLDILTKPGEREPTIVLCLRDSLLGTNEGLRDFCEEYCGTVTIYDLLKWEMPSKRAFAKMELGEQEAEKFIAVLQTHSEINNLSSIPFYCKLILEEYGAGKLQQSYSEPGLLQSAVLGIIEREYDKGLLDADLLPASSLIELLQDLASVDMAADFQGLSRDTIAEYTAILLPAELDSVTLDRLTTNMVQLAVFGQAPVAGNVQFAQEILEHYLLGERLYRNLVNNEDLFLRELSVRSIPSEWVTLRTVAEKAREGKNIEKLLKCLETPGLSPITFRNVLQISAHSVTDPTVLRQTQFEPREIPGVRFSDLDFRGVSFRNCDLTDVEFHNCLLQDAKFEGAILRNTAFLLKDKEDMRDARFGNLQRFYSLRILPGKLETDYHVVQQWLRERTGVVEEIVEPCAAAMQLRYLFGKYIHPNGLAKRAILDRHGVLSGKRFYDAERTLEATVRHGYLVAEERYRDRIKRCDGDLYTEIISYVKDLRLSPGLRRLLDEICPVENCRHIPGATE